MMKEYDPITNIEKIHTTELGAIRIKKNLNLDTDDIVEWCKSTVKQSDIIIGQGKNWYVYHRGIVLTINKHSYTVITAHKINAKVRIMEKRDYTCLKEFLYQAIFISDRNNIPSRSSINNPELYIYIKNFGEKVGDLGVVAEQNDQVIGAAWTRIIPAHGHLDDSTPELAISILPEFRGYGTGTKLMNKLFEILKENGYTQTSLSVQKNNPAVQFYRRLGYEIINDESKDTNSEDYLMLKKLL